MPKRRRGQSNTNLFTLSSATEISELARISEPEGQNFMKFNLRRRTPIKKEVRIKHSEEKVKEALTVLINTTHVKSTNDNLKQSNEIEEVTFMGDKLQYSIIFKDNSTAVVKQKWVDDYIDGNDSESKRLIEDALVMRAKFF